MNRNYLLQHNLATNNLKQMTYLNHLNNPHKQQFAYDQYFIIKLLEVTLKSSTNHRNDSPLETDKEYFSFILQNQHHIYKTTAFISHNNKIDLTSSKALHLKNHQKPSEKNTKNKIILSMQMIISSNKLNEYVHSKTELNYLNIQEESERIIFKKPRGNKCLMERIIILPMFDSKQHIVSEITISVKNSYILRQTFEQEVLKKSQLQRKSQQNVVYSRLPDRYFQPIISREIKVKILYQDDSKCTSIQSQLISINKTQESLSNQNKMPTSGQQNELLSKQNKEQQVNQMEQKQIHFKLPSSELQQHEGFPSSYTNPFSQQFASNFQSNSNKVEHQNEDEYFKELFNKIYEINRRYEPLEKISSQSSLNSTLNNERSHLINEKSFNQQNYQQQALAFCHIKNSEHFLEELKKQVQ